MGLTTIVLLIRHGENEYVSTHRLAGRTPDVHLNDKGREQASALVRMLASQPIQAVYSSPIERCLETAEPLAAALHQSVVAEPGILEVDYGSWQGGDLRELSKTAEWSQVQQSPSLFQFPGGEALRNVQVRAVNAIEQLRVKHPNQVIALFSHGDVIRTALAYYMGIPFDLFQRIIISTASVSILAFFDGRPAILGMNIQTEFPKVEIKQEEASHAGDTPEIEGSNHK